MSWRARTLDQLGTVARGRSRHRPRDAAHLYGGPHPFIQTGDVKHAGLYITGASQTYNDAGLAQSKLWSSGTLCITIAANIAETAILGIDACFPDSVIGFVPDPDEADARFVKYLFDATIQQRVQQFAQGATQDNLSQEKLLSLLFEVPDVDEQRRLADVMEAYDALIATNRRRIALLEEAARLLYREWFVRLRFPGHEGVAVVDGVPVGWARRTLGEVAPLRYGKALKDEDREPGAYAVYGSSGVVGSHERPLSVGPGLVIGRKGNVGSVFWSPRAFWPIDTAYFIDGNDANLFVYYALLNTHFINTDVAVPGLNRDMAHSRELLMPPAELVREFLASAEAMWAQIDGLQRLNDKLTTARDLLLPRLMSGEVVV